MGARPLATPVLAPCGATYATTTQAGEGCVHETDDFLAIGWMAPEGRCEGGLMVARVERGALAYSGTVATGVAGEMLVQLRARLAPQRGPTISHPALVHRAHRIEWATPTVAVRVAMRGWTDDGLLRHPSLVAVLAA